ncbi:hypothetical protein D3C71_1760950 [compost metagenome]
MKASHGDGQAAVILQYVLDARTGQRLAQAFFDACDLIPVANEALHVKVGHRLDLRGGHHLAGMVAKPPVHRIGRKGR